MGRGKRNFSFFNLHSSLSFILGSARRIFLAAAVATTATASRAADAYWTGATDNYFKTAGNWDINAKPTSQTTFFQASKFNSRFTENEVVFDGAYSISAQFSVRAVGTAENPLVWRATDAANGLKSTANNSLIGWNTGDAYLKIVNGTWQVAGSALEIGKANKGWLYLKDINSFTVSGNNNYLKIDNGSTLILDGGTVSVGKNMELGGNVANKSATYIQKNGTLTVSGDIYLGKNSSSTSGDLYFELGGGTVTAGAIAHGAGTASAKVKFDGGTLKQSASNPYANGVLQYNAKLTAVVGSKGGTIDSNNKAIYIGASIGNADGEVGGMRFKGGSTITFKDTATPTYTGGTTVELGTKLVASTDAARDAILGNLIVDGLHQVTAQDFTVFEYSGGGLSKDNVSFVNCGPATYAEVVGNTIVVHFDPGWVGTSDAVKVFPGKTLSDIEYGIFTSRFGGRASADTNRYTPNSAGGYNVKRYYDDGGSVTNIVVEFQVKEGSTVKCVVVEFTDDGTDVYAKALGGRAKANVDLGYVFLEQNRTTWNGDGPYDIVTNITDWYYGVFDLRVKLPVSWTLDADKNWSTLRNGATLASDEIVRITVTGGEKKHTLTVDEDVDIGQIMFVDGSGAILKIATGRTLEADSITGLGFPWVDSGAMLYVDGTVDATSLKNDGTVVKRVADVVSIPVHNGSAGTTIVSNGTLKVSKKYASGTTHTIRVVSGARFDMNGVQDVTAKFVLEDGATFANTGAEIDGKKAQAVSLSLEGSATAAFSNNFGLIGPSYGETTLALGSNTLTLNGSNRDFWLCNTTITGDGMIYVEHGWLHPTNTASVGAACTLNIPSGGALNLEADLTVANFVNGANNGNIKGGNTLTVTGQLTPGSAAIPKLSLASGATVKATGTPQVVSMAFSASGTINIDISDISQQVRDAGDEGVSVLTVPTVPAGVRWNVTGADNFRAKWVGNTLYVVKSDGLMVIIR